VRGRECFGVRPRSWRFSQPEARFRCSAHPSPGGFGAAIGVASKLAGGKAVASYRTPKRLRANVGPNSVRPGPRATRPYHRPKTLWPCHHPCSSNQNKSCRASRRVDSLPLSEEGRMERRMSGHPDLITVCTWIIFGEIGLEQRPMEFVPRPPLLRSAALQSQSSSRCCKVAPCQTCCVLFLGTEISSSPCACFLGVQS